MTRACLAGDPTEPTGLVGPPDDPSRLDLLARVEALVILARSIREASDCRWGAITKALGTAAGPGEQHPMKLSDARRRARPDRPPVD